MSAAVATVQSHVRPEQVIEFDIYADQRLREDLHRGYRTIQKGTPDIFFTPSNGGHWVITRMDVMAGILKDPEHFSNRELDIPRSNSPNVMIPLNLDPPDHGVYRAAIMRYVDKKSIAAREDMLRGWARRLIDQVVNAGQCDFAKALGGAYPVSVFMDMMGMPMERYDRFRGIVLEYFGMPTTVARRIEIQDTIIAIITDMVEQRRKTPGDDLVSKLVQEQVNGRPLTLTELQSIGFLLFIAGLDTVANALTFAFHQLAGNPSLQKRLGAEPERIPDFVEESLRCFGVVNQTRLVKKNIDIAGTAFREGDMVLCMLPMAGIDERANPDPERFDIDRKNREHIIFSAGAHTCVGNILARAEMRVFTEEWIKRIPEFQMAQGVKLDWRPGLVIALRNLPLEWKV